MSESSDHLFAQSDLLRLAGELLVAAGLERRLAEIVADVLVEANMMGHTTHGLALIPTYLTAIESGAMATSGAPELLRDEGGCVT